MTEIKTEAVEKIKNWLRVPVEDGDGERASRKSDVESLSPRFGSLVFEDERWYEYDAGRINQIMQRQGQEWLDDAQVGELERLADAGGLGYFIDWFEQLLQELELGERGVYGPAREGGAVGEALGIANPNYASDPVPGTQYYKYDPVQGYVYAETEDAAEWRTMEERIDAQRLSGASGPDDGRQRGYPNAQATIPGTRYYTLHNGGYLYSDKEYGDDDHGWQPYEYWQRLQKPAKPAEPEKAATTIEAAVEEATAAAFADFDLAALADLGLSADDIDSIADAVAAQIASDIEG
jgi:hypothetical protein